VAEEVIVYTTPFCVSCDQLKSYLTKNGIAFVQKDLMMDEDAADLLDDHNIRSAPALQIDGKLYGGADLSPEKVDALLGI
jgi:glutaredoxin